MTSLMCPACGKSKHPGRECEVGPSIAQWWKITITLINLTVVEVYVSSGVEAKAYQAQLLNTDNESFVTIDGKAKTPLIVDRRVCVSPRMVGCVDVLEEPSVEYLNFEDYHGI